MTAAQLPRFIGSAFPHKLSLWALPIITAMLIITDMFWVDLNSMRMTMIAAGFIALAGIPHGTLDVEIAAGRFGLSSTAGKAKIIGAYLACAMAMLFFWTILPEGALISFLIISVVHFSRDWRGGADPFLAMMVGSALVALPALASPAEVATIFETLTGNQNGQTISALLGCVSVPVSLGSLVFAYWSYKNDDKKSAAEVVACLIAALFLPPLVAFAVFFCGLHSPRHFAEALRETGNLSPAKKAAIIIFVSALSIGIGALLFSAKSDVSVDIGIIRVAFMLISTLTVPHFLLEHLLSQDQATP